MSNRELWRERIPTRQPRPSLENRQSAWLTWLLPPTNLRDIPLWAIPRLTVPGIAFSMGNILSYHLPIAAAGWMMVALAIPCVIFVFISQALAKGNQPLQLINFFLIGFGVFIVVGYIL
jgi:hypothetical protein